MHNLAIIPARGGSKRIPDKNIRDFLGKPIISYSIDIALRSNLFNEIMVSTDSKKIAEIAKEYGASVPFLRSKKTSEDFSTLSDVIEEVKTEYLMAGVIFNYICCILPTAPLTKPENIIHGFNLLREHNADSVKPVVRYLHPIERALVMQDNKVRMRKPEHYRTRSQDLETSYFDAGQFYWMTSEKGLLGENKYGFEIPELECQDIDTLTDWEMAEIKYKRLFDIR